MSLQFSPKTEEEILKDLSKISKRKLNIMLIRMLDTSYEFDYNKIMLLIKAGANVNTKSPAGMTPLMIACRACDNTNLIKLLIDVGAKINKSTRYEGWTALFVAAANGRNNIIRVLIDNGAFINPRTTEGYNLTPLGYAVYKKQFVTAELLRSYGAKE